MHVLSSSIRGLLGLSVGSLVVLAACGGAQPAASPVSSAPAPAASSPAAKPSAPASSAAAAASAPASAKPSASTAASPSGSAVAKPATSASASASAAAVPAPGTTPVPSPVKVDPKTTALLVLDQSARCDDPAQVCNKLAPQLKTLVDKARASKMFTIFTVSEAKGTPLGVPWKGFDVKPDELVINMSGFDKLMNPDVAKPLKDHGVKTLIVTGSSANVAVMYTATGAASNNDYDVIVPEDGTTSSNDVNNYKTTYALYQLSALPSGKKIQFTTLAGISMGS